MRLIAQRVVQPGPAPMRRAGFNAYCFLHGDRFWLDAPPSDLGRGQLVNQIVEVDPPVGNRVRSHLDVVAPDATPSRQIAAAVQAGAEFLADAGTSLPWHLAHGEVSFEFNVEAALASQWQVELRLLLGYVLAVRAADPQAGGGVLAGDVFQG